MATPQTVLPALSALFDDVAKMRANGAALAIALCKESAQAAIARLQSVRGDERYYGVGAMIEALSGEPVALAGTDPENGIWRYGLGKIPSPGGIGSAPAHPIAEFLAYYRAQGGAGPRNFQRPPHPRPPRAPKPGRPLSEREATMLREARNREALFESAQRQQMIPPGAAGATARRTERHIQLILLTPLPAAGIARVVASLHRGDLKVSAPISLRKDPLKPNKTYRRVVRPKASSARSTLERVLRGVQAERGDEVMAHPRRRGGMGPAEHPGVARLLVGDRPRIVTHKIGHRAGGASYTAQITAIRPHGLYGTVRHLSNAQIEQIINAVPVAENFTAYGGSRSYRFQLSLRGLRNAQVRTMVELALSLPKYTTSATGKKTRSFLPRLRLPDRRPVSGRPERAAVYARQKASRTATRAEKMRQGGWIFDKVSRKERTLLSGRKMVLPGTRVSLGSWLIKGQGGALVSVRRGLAAPLKGPAVYRVTAHSLRAIVSHLGTMGALPPGLSRLGGLRSISTQGEGARAMLLPLAQLGRFSPALRDRLQQNIAAGLTGRQNSVLNGLYTQYRLPANAPHRTVLLDTKLTREQARTVQRGLSLMRTLLTKETH